MQSLDVIYNLWLRHMLHYFRSRASVIGALGQPILFLLSLGGGFQHVFRKAGEGNYLQFLAPGVIGMTVLFASAYTGAELMWDRKFGFLKASLVAPAPRIVIMVGRTLGGASVAMVQGIVVVAICAIAGFRPSTLMGLVYGLLFTTLIAVMFTSLGMSVAAMLQELPSFQVFINLLIMPVFFLSGALFPLNNVPRYLGFIAKINPFAYGVDGMRSAFFGNAAHFGTAVDLSVMVCITLLLLVCGSYLFSRIEA